MTPISICRPASDICGLGVLDFVNADGVDLAQRPVLQSPGDDVPTASNTLSQEVRSTLRFLSTKAAAPNGLKSI